MDPILPKIGASGEPGTVQSIALTECPQSGSAPVTSALGEGSSLEPLRSGMRLRLRLVAPLKRLKRSISPVAKTSCQNAQLGWRTSQTVRVLTQPATREHTSPERSFRSAFRRSGLGSRNKHRNADTKPYIMASTTPPISIRSPIFLKNVGKTLHN